MSYCPHCKQPIRLGGPKHRCPGSDASGSPASSLFCLDRQFTGERLREARERNFWSQADLAKRTGLPAAAISHWECGRRMPGLENLWTLLSVLQVSADDVLGLRLNADGDARRETHPNQQDG